MGVGLGLGLGVGLGLGLGVGVGLVGRVGEHRERALGKVLEHADLWLGEG